MSSWIFPIFHFLHFFPEIGGQCVQIRLAASGHIAVHLFQNHFVIANILANNFRGIDFLASIRLSDHQIPFTVHRHVRRQLHLVIKGLATTFRDIIITGAGHR